ncbi:HET-domain-containing protein [Westerdykella ornata]|uniref:HET-domain-containing protein n=1 Tax=Westerdykella ornata TaxID=318751 RepID=A0A6A6JPP6_WESOR|nr:HET-domain-containing protein [Westerdykella ornata]KAF2278225.1 HET-domain-containing protein [Westerdykella ornata]
MAPRIPKRTLAVCAGLLTDGDFSATLEQTMSLDNSHTGSPAALELASFWLQRCLATHENCRGTEPAEKRFVPTRVVYVGNNDNEIRLVETSKELQGDNPDRRFVALSHCWGPVQIIRTLQNNYEEHLKHIDPSLLSKTFKEAVHTTRTLGYRYLWIDSLCIIQDSKEDWLEQAATMCDVYRYATFTIAAAHAPGGDIGCFEKRDGIVQFPFFVEIPTAGVNQSDGTKNARIQFSSYGRVEAPLGREPPLYGRSWVLQEQLLSPRMLIFDGPQIRWECLSMHGSERSPLGGMSRHIGHQKLIRSGVMDDEDFFNKPDQDDPDFSQRYQHYAWCYTIMDYTHRGMTQPSDRLVALHGIAQALVRKTRYQYVAGLWEHQLWAGLLWSIPHTKQYTATTEDAFDFENRNNPGVRHKNEVAPSWSWASVTVPVVYPAPTILYVHRICEIQDVSVTGTPDSQTGSVRIRGHVRTGYVNSIYPYAIREAEKAYPSMAFGKHTGETRLFTFRDRSFSPTNYFIFSPTRPKDSKNILQSSEWRLARGLWRPDQVLDPQTEITFIAIAQQNSGTEEGKLVTTHKEDDPLTVYTIGLVPTGRVEGEYKRVGYAEWDSCSWYGYLCGAKSRPGRDIQKVEGWRSKLSRDPLYGSKPTGKETHDHRFESDTLPNIENYQKSAEARETVVTIV